MRDYQNLWLKYFPQFVDSGDAATRSLMASAQILKVPVGQQVFYPGCECDNYLLLLEGKVKVQLISENGRVIKLYQVSSGDSCVLTTSCLLGGNCYPAEAITETEVMVFAISKHAFHRCIAQSDFFREFVFKKFSNRLTAVIARMEEVVFDAIDLRLSRVLLNFGVDIIYITHHELAAELGTAREVISRHLKRFESYGWLHLNRGIIKITDLSALKKLLN